MEEKKSFLTELQAKVLKLRSKGLTQTEIAEKLETSRSNVCSLEKRARNNIEKARETISLAEKIQAPMSVEVKPGDDIIESTKKLFSKADEKGIHISLDTPGLISMIEEKTENKLKGRKAEEKIEISATREGKVIIS